MTKKWAWPQKPPRSFAECWVACRVVGVTCVLRILLGWVALPRLLGWLTPTREILSPDLAAFPSVVRWVDGTLRRFPSNPRGSCLVRSLALYYFGRRCGYSVQFHCGVRKPEGILTGHAWLSVGGEPFWEQGDPFGINIVTFSYPPKSEGEGLDSRISEDDRLLLQSSLSRESDPELQVEHSMGCDLREK